MARNLIARLLALPTIVVAAAGCASGRTSPLWLATGTQGMVASDSIYASRAGLEILRAGGNAFDAAAAVSFALAVTRPQSTGLGGGGFLIARLPASAGLGGDGEIIVSDFRETAPAAATPDMYSQAVQRDPKGPAPSRFGCLAVGTPGVLAGRVQMLERYGTRSLAECLAPAIRLAREGFRVDQAYVEACDEVAGHYREHPALVESCSYVYSVHLRSGHLPRPGDTLVQPELARLLETIAAEGPGVFYRGRIAQAIERTVRAGGGILRADDLANYRVADRAPLVSSYRGYTVISMPPPSSGGICLAEALNILEHFDLAEAWRRDPGLARHYLIEAMKHAFADRARWLGDTDFVTVPVGLLTSKVYATQLARNIDPQQCQDIDTYGADQIPDDAGTSHFCVMDRWGNGVVSTETINTPFGSLAAVDEWGLILNNEMDDFATEPGQANAYGLIQLEGNAVAPGKRPLSSMAPTIVLAAGRPVLLLGASGGPRIISSVLNVLVAVTDFGLSMADAMTLPRVHHQWQPDEVVLDAAAPPALVQPLSARGHRLGNEFRTGVVQAIRVDGPRLIGASDPRKGGAPAGY